MNCGIFIDLDETLVYSARVGSEYSTARKLIALPGAKQFIYDNREKWVTFKRNGVDEFLTGCKTLAPTYILTSGNKLFQDIILQQHGIHGVQLFGRQEYDKLPKHELNILVDDLDIRTMGVQLKMACLCPELMTDQINKENPKRFQLVQVKPWYNPVPEKALTDALTQVRSIIRPEVEISM